jgi:hypothetical protein
MNGKFEYIKKISFFNRPFREGNWNGSVSLLNWRNAGSVTRIFKNSGREFPPGAGQDLGRIISPPEN